MNKSTLYGAAAREKILSGAKKITDAIRVTLGPLGRNVIISQSIIAEYNMHNLPLHITKDGWTVAKCFDVTDEPFEKVGVLMVKECTKKTVEQAGDGTTTCCILAYAILEKGIELINAGASPIEVKNGIDKAVEYVVSELKKMAIPVAGDIERVRQVATVSANNDSSIGDLIADAFAKIGDYGVIDIEEAAGTETEIKVAQGYKFDKGWVSPLFVNNREKQTCEFENPLILLYQNRITHHTQYQRAIEMAINLARPIVIICEDADEEGLAVLVRNNYEQRIKCCVIRSPFFGLQRMETMEDIAVATGGKYISDSKGVGIKEIDQSYFGQAKKIIISKDETVIIEGSAHEGSVNDLLNELKMNLTQAKNEAEKELIEKRIARLTGGVAVIYVGAATETEMREKKDRVDDAVRSTKAAISEGFIVGAGTAFVAAYTPLLDFIRQHNLKTDFAKGAGIIADCLAIPLFQICANAGVKNTEEILQKVCKEELNIGYNAKTGEIENLLDSGILDPIKVLRCALQNAASSAGMILTSECCIVDIL